jgi:hypothetical protein
VGVVVGAAVGEIVGVVVGEAVGVLWHTARLSQQPLGFPLT